MIAAHQPSRPDAAEDLGGRPLAVFAPVLRQWGFICVFSFSSALSALGMTYVVSAKYEATTTLSYRPQEVTQMKPQEQKSFGAPVPMAPFKVIYQTLQALIKNQSLLRQLVLEFGLNVAEPRIYEGPFYYVWYRKAKDFLLDTGEDIIMVLKYGRVIKKDSVQEAMEKLAKNIKIGNKESYVFYISIRDKNPQRAAALADRLADRLIDWLRDQDREPGEQKRDQLLDLREKKTSEIASIQSELKQLLAENHVASVQLEIEHVADQMAKLEMNLTQVDGDIQLHRAKLAIIREKLETKKTVADLMETPGESTARLKPDDLKRLASERVIEEVELDGLEAKRRSLGSSINSLEKRRARLPALQMRREELKLHLENAERDLTQLNDSYQEANVRATGRASEGERLHPAAVPSTPVSPIKLYHVALSFFLALLVSTGLVYVLSYFNVRLLLAPER